MCDSWGIAKEVFYFNDIGTLDAVIVCVKILVCVVDGAIDNIHFDGMVVPRDANTIVAVKIHRFGFRDINGVRVVSECGGGSG